VPETDDTDIREFLDHDYERMVAGLTLMTGSQAMAEDAVQEALARAWERMDRGQRFDSLKAWVTVVATNLIRSGLRRLYAERRARARLTAPDRPTGALERSEDRMDVIVAVRALPRRQREATVLHYYLDLSVADVARALRVSEGAVKNALHHARRAVSAALSDATDLPPNQEEEDVAGR